MTRLSSDAIVEAMNWRYATKAFDKNRNISAEDRSALLEVLRLSPSSRGLQPWKFLVVDDTSARRRFGELVPPNKAKFEDSSLLVVMARRRTTTADDVARHIEALAAARGVSAEELQPFQEGLVEGVVSKPQAEMDAWNTKQLYVALGCAITAAAVMNIDCCPMEGVNPEGFDEVLGLSGTEFTTTLAVGFGYRDEADPFASYGRGRRSAQDVIQIV